MTSFNLFWSTSNECISAPSASPPSSSSASAAAAAASPASRRACSAAAAAAAALSAAPAALDGPAAAASAAAAAAAAALAAARAAAAAAVLALGAAPSAAPSAGRWRRTRIWESTSSCSSCAATSASPRCGGVHSRKKPLLRITSFTLPVREQHSCTFLSTSIGSSAFENLVNESLISPVVSPSEAPAYSEYAVSWYSCRKRVRHLGSAMATRKSTASFSTGEPDSSRIRPFGQTHSGFFSWSCFSLSVAR